ncbi:hypothetical protein LG943_12140 [Streptomonospora sp. S1-112]|uniref:Uncharacterized protein n=1 Tax=Streptomonospora mangrovi TaxID=2883123 RepID=A0A9X3SDP3_9ACTN|nr:hypothetical protein [Streptomonospora mangrovi]MDA0565063.1 hypothetical protein [Streptomonospora mangrovi]
MGDSKAYQEGKDYTAWAAKANQEIREEMPPAEEPSGDEGGDQSTGSHP